MRRVASAAKAQSDLAANRCGGRPFTSMAVRWGTEKRRLMEADNRQEADGISVAIPAFTSPMRTLHAVAARDRQSCHSQSRFRRVRMATSAQSNSPGRIGTQSRAGRRVRNPVSIPSATTLTWNSRASATMACTIAEAWCSILCRNVRSISSVGRPQAWRGRRVRSSRFRSRRSRYVPRVA